MNDPDFWRCRSCGCLWRDNHDGSVSLGSAKQTSCALCEDKTDQACEPLYRLAASRVPDPQTKDDSLAKPNGTDGESVETLATKWERWANNPEGPEWTHSARVAVRSCATELRALSGAPRKELKHPTRTIIVATRLSEKVLHTTYLNALDDDPPYIVTVTLSEPPHAPVDGGVPDVGQTKVTVNR